MSNPGEKWGPYLDGCGAGAGAGTAATLGTVGTARLGLAISSPVRTKMFSAHRKVLWFSPDSLFFFKVSLGRNAMRLILTRCVPVQTLLHGGGEENKMLHFKGGNTKITHRYMLYPSLLYMYTTCTQSKNDWTPYSLVHKYMNCEWW